MKPCFAAALSAVLIGLLSACAAEIGAPSEAPPVQVSAPAANLDSSAVSSREAWEAGTAPALKRALQDIEYGRYPAPDKTRVVYRHVLDASDVPGAGAFEDVRLKLKKLGREFSVTYMLPAGDGPFPTVIQISFCGNKAAFGGRDGVYEPAGLPGFCTTMDLAPSADADPYLRSLPVEMLLARGYAVVSVQPGEVIPDNPGAAMPVLQALAGKGPEESRTGAIAAWGWVVSRTVDYLESDARFDASRTALMGHSRNGKAAMAAAVFDPRIDLVWLHQSGTGGATLFSSDEGESIQNITGGFPHWLAPALNAYRGRDTKLPFDQDDAIALIAPRPVLVGAAYDDTWAGPEGAFEALEGAASVYGLYDGVKVDLPSMSQPDLSSDLAYFIRPGRHGTTKSDWEIFADFLDVHFKGAPAPQRTETVFDMALFPGRLDLSEKGEPVLSYNMRAPDGLPAWHTNYIHPLYAPSGTVVTEDAPEDHPHHRGLFTAWRHIHSGDRDLGDAWEGRDIAFKGHLWHSDMSDPDQVEFRIRTDWISLTGEEPEVFLKENTAVVVTDVSPGVRKIYQRTALQAQLPDLLLEGEDPIKGYGGPSFRFGHPDTMTIADQGTPVNATEAQIETSGWLTFAWPEREEGWPASIEVRCYADGQIVQSWIVRQWPSAQNCTYPGLGSYKFESDKELILESYVIIHQY
ncbi:MAG: DUF6807 family protein [Hyphomonas sp.]